MHPISIKAVLISNAVQLGMTLVVLFVAAISTLSIAWGFAGFPADIDPIASALKASPLFVSLIGTISVLPSSLTAGYVASRVARERHVLHGVLSSGLWIILLVCIALGDTSSGHSSHGGTDAGSALLGFVVCLGTPLFGALGGFIGKYKTQGQRATMVVPQYSNWWWLGYDKSWTAEERRARIVMWMTLMVCFVAAMFVISTLIDWIGVEPHRGAFISAVLSLVIGLYAARPVATELYRDLVRRADEGAWERLSGTTREVG
jgi:hypothetical protein